MSNEPKRHHYIPQFFSKAWLSDNHLKMVDKNAPGKVITVSTKNFGLGNKLYKLNSQIESEFITPFIDNLAPSINDAKTKSWSELSQKVKNDFYKFIILLDARNPNSISSMQQALIPLKEKFICLLKKNFSINENVMKEIDSGLDNGVLVFMMIAIQEANIMESDIDIKIKDGVIKDTIKFCFRLMDLARNYLPKSFYIDDFDKYIVVNEFNCLERMLITSDRAISRKGCYDKEFTLLFNISPEKGYFISNEKDIIKSYNKLPHLEKIKYFNQSIEKFSTKYIICP
ncbi:DUF4238 domain-containing protein [Mannheimia sp. HC-2023]|uniref:DUF4238 domain-containing protein n=1 Tax=Mannheimia indoligenes TaxID=3103145 RepID=UPI002FE5E2C9